MRLMGVITCSAPMNPSANVTYTHKKFKRAQKEACESTDLQQQQQQQQQPQQQQQQQQKEVGERNGKTEASTVPVVPRSTSSYLVGSHPVNGFLPLTAQLPATITNITAAPAIAATTTVGSFVQPHPDAEDGKRKGSSGSSSGKHICEYCGVGCAKPSVLDKHKRTHTNERPFSCHQCSIAFKTKSNFLKHTRSRAHALRCDGGGQDGSDATVESSDNQDAEGDDGSRCSSRDGAGHQSHPTDLSITHHTSTPTPHVTPQEESSREKGSLYKPKSKFRIQYQEEGTVKRQSPPVVRQHSAPSQQDAIAVDSAATSNLSTYQLLPASHPSPYSHGAHSSPGSHSPSPGSLSKPCLPPLDIRAANRKEEGSTSSSSSGHQNSVATPRSFSQLWKNMKSPSPELVGQHITKLIVENQVIVDTHNPLCLRRYKRQPSIGSSSSESDGSGSGKNRRNSLVDSTYKTGKTPTPGPLQAQQRERAVSYTSETTMVERQSSYSPSLPPTPNLPLAQPSVTPVSASKPSISVPGITTSYSQSPPILTAPSISMMDPSLMDGARKQCIAEGPSVVRDVHKNRIMPPVDDVTLLRQHPCNPEGSVIKNLLLTARESISSAIDRHENAVRVAGHAVPLSEVMPTFCVCCRTPFRNHEEYELHMRHCCGQRLAGGRDTPDSMKGGDGGRWVVRAGAGAREQDEALDLQKKPDPHPPHHQHHHHQHHHHHLDRERSSSRGSSSGDPPPVRRGSQDDPRGYRYDPTPAVSRSKSVPDGSLPHNKKRKLSDVEIQNSSSFLTPVFPGKVHGGCKNELGMKLSIDEITKQSKQSNLQLFGGEVQICDGNECKTMRIDPSQQPSPAMDIRIPPQQLGGSISKPEVSVPTSVVVTIAKSGLNSGGTMVQVDSKTSTSSTKTVPSLVNSSLHTEHSGGLPVLSPGVPKAAHSPAMYNTSFSPSFLQYAPHLQLPNLAIPGIPAPDLGSMSFSTYSTRTPSQTSLLHPQTSMTQGLLGGHKQGVSRSALPLQRPAQVTYSPSNKATSPHPAPPPPPPPMVMHTGSHPLVSIHPPLSEASHHPLIISEKDKDYPKVPSKMGYPTLIPVGDEKVPYVPGIPGPYSQANMVNPPSKSSDRSSIPSLSHLSQPPPPPPPIPYVSPSISVSPRSSMVPSSPREKATLLALPRPRDTPHSPIRDHGQAPGLIKMHHRTSPKEMTSSRPKTSPPSSVISEMKSVTPEIRVHPVASSDSTENPEKKQQVVAEKSGTTVSESKKTDNSQKCETTESEEFLPPRKRPNFLELKPQPFTPKSSLALIGTTLVSPDTPRPKKSCVQMFLNGSAYTYLGHKVSTKSYFCCIYRQQPMYVPQSTDPKLSMYSNWQIRKPAEDNPLKLSPYQSMSLYESCKYDRAYTIAKPKELNLIQTHSSYWTFKEEKEKTKGKEVDNQSKDEAKEVKVEEEKEESPKTSVKEESGPSVKREAEDHSPNPEPRGKGSSSQEGGEGQERGPSTAKRIKIFEGGFKSMEEYTYVRGRGRGRYVCETCGIRCKKPSMLRKHIRTHTDLRPYACVHCSFSFKTKGNLTKHLRSKAHYKRCEEMGIVPVPTVVDDSHLNHRALALQGKLEQEGRSDGMECDDEDDDEDEDDEEDEDEDDDEEEGLEGGNIQFQDAQSHTSTSTTSPPSPPAVAAATTTREEAMVEARDEGTKDATTRARGVRSGVLVMHPAAPTLPSSGTTLPPQPQLHTSSSKEASTKVQQPQQQGTTGSETTGDSPMDLSVKKMPTTTLTTSTAANTTTTTHGPDKPLALNKSVPVGNPSRPSFLPLMSRSAVPPDLRSPVATSLSSPVTPSTPIREHPFEILSPVTESSTLLKSIYNTTERASHVSNEKQPHVVPDPTKENGSSSFMLQAYLKECAVLDSTIKRHQYKDSLSDTSPDSPCTTTTTPINHFHTSSSLTLTTTTTTKSTPTPNSSRHSPETTSTTTTTTHTSKKTENMKKETSSQHTKGESEAASMGHQGGRNPSPCSLSVSSSPSSVPTTAFTSTSTTTTTTTNNNTATTTSTSITIAANSTTASPPSSLPNTTATTTTSSNNSNNSVSQVTSITSSSSLATAITTTSRMPTPPANLTVMNNGGMDTKTAFLVPSGVVPSSLNRLGNDDGKCKCSFCHKEFNRHSQLSIHMNIHYMERPYRCESCAVSFRTNGHLQKHKRSVSHFNKVNMNMTFGPPSSDNPRPFKCRDCKIAFRIHGHLAKHLRSKMHIMKLECLGKLPFGTYAEMERSGANLNEIDTTDCDNSLESLKVMATRMYEKDPTKLSTWQTQPPPPTHRVRTVSSSSTSSDDYPLQDDQDDPSASHATPPNDDDTEGDEDEEIPLGREAGRPGSGAGTGSSVSGGAGPIHSPRPHPLSHVSPIEVGAGATAGLVACHLCHEKFLDIEHLSGHLYTVHKVSVTYRNS